MDSVQKTFVTKVDLAMLNWWRLSYIMKYRRSVHKNSITGIIINNNFDNKNNNHNLLNYNNCDNTNNDDSESLLIEMKTVNAATNGEINIGYDELLEDSIKKQHFDGSSDLKMVPKIEMPKNEKTQRKNKFKLNDNENRRISNFIPLQGYTTNFRIPVRISVPYKNECNMSPIKLLLRDRSIDWSVLTKFIRITRLSDITSTKDVSHESDFPEEQIHTSIYSTIYDETHPRDTSRVDKLKISKIRPWRYYLRKTRIPLLRKRKGTQKLENRLLTVLQPRNYGSQLRRKTRQGWLKFWKVAKISWVYSPTLNTVHNGAAQDEQSNKCTTDLSQYFELFCSTM